MGFSKSCLEQYKREIRILWRVLAIGALAAAGFHLFSIPAILRYAGGLRELASPADELETTPVDIVVVDEEITPEPEEVTPPPPEETAVTNETAAAAAQPSPLPQASDPLVSEPASADSINTVATGPAITSEIGVEDSEGAAGEADTIGSLPGSGSPEGNSTAPISPSARTRQPVEEVARARSPSARTVTCAPCTQPDYPLTERRDRIEGQPVINVIFDQNGNVVTAKIEKSSGNAAFDQAALEEARRNWRFRDPYGLGGQVSVEVTFVIEGSEQYEAAEAAGRQDTIDLPVEQSITPVAPDADDGPIGEPSTPTSPASSRSTPESDSANAPEPEQTEPSGPNSAAPADGDSANPDATRPADPAATPPAGAPLSPAPILTPNDSNTPTRPVLDAPAEVDGEADD